MACLCWYPDGIALAQITESLGTAHPPYPECKLEFLMGHFCFWFCTVLLLPFAQFILRFIFSKKWLLLLVAWHALSSWTVNLSLVWMKIQLALFIYFICLLA